MRRGALAPPGRSGRPTRRRFNSGVAVLIRATVHPLNAGIDTGTAPPLTARFLFSWSAIPVSLPEMP